MLAGLKAREQRIRKDIAEAEAARAKAEATLKRVQHAARHAPSSRSATCIAKATADGEQIAASIRARAEQEAAGGQGARHPRNRGRQASRRVAEIYEQAADAGDERRREDPAPEPQRRRPARPGARSSLEQVQNVKQLTDWRSGHAPGRHNGSAMLTPHGHTQRTTPPPPSPTPARCSSWRNEQQQAEAIGDELREHRRGARRQNPTFRAFLRDPGDQHGRAQRRRSTRVPGRRSSPLLANFLGVLNIQRPPRPARRRSPTPTPTCSTSSSARSRST